MQCNLRRRSTGICFYRNQAWNNSDCNIKTFFLYFRTLIDKLSKSFMMAAYFGPNLSKLCVVSSTTLCSTFDMIKKVMMMNSIKNKAFTFPAPVMKFCHGIRVVFRWFWLGENIQNNCFLNTLSIWGVFRIWSSK